jgi:CheY-like chemotaxis protein
MHTLDSALHRTALIVEYDLWERWFATHLLASQAYQVVSTSNGASALRLAHQHRCDVILIGLALPEIAGPELVRQLSMNPATREIPVIVLSKPVDEAQVVADLGKVLSGA